MRKNMLWIVVISQGFLEGKDIKQMGVEQGLGAHKFVN
jgi:hypothetical protein